MSYGRVSFSLHCQVTKEAHLPSHDTISLLIPDFSDGPPITRTEIIQYIQIFILNGLFTAILSFGTSFLVRRRSLPRPTT